MVGVAGHNKDETVPSQPAERHMPYTMLQLMPTMSFCNPEKP